MGYNDRPRDDHSPKPYNKRYNDRRDRSPKPYGKRYHDRRTDDRDGYYYDAGKP